MRGRQQVDRGRVVGKASIGERSSRNFNRVRSQFLSKNKQGHAMCPCFLEVGNRLFHFRRQAIIYLWLLCLIFLSVYLTDFELYLGKGVEGT